MGYTRRSERAYSRVARLYDVAVKRLPVWKTWLNKALPHIEGRRVLEISFGTGYLLAQYASHLHCVGLDYNQRMVETAQHNLRNAKIHVPLLRGDVHYLPFPDESFDCVVNTMAFSGYANGTEALGEIRRVLRPSGRLVFIDVAYPLGDRPAGIFLANLWKFSGDLIRDIPSLLTRLDFEYTDQEIGGFGSIHLYLASKAARQRRE